MIKWLKAKFKQKNCDHQFIKLEPYSTYFCEHCYKRKSMSHTHEAEEFEFLQVLKGKPVKYSSEFMNEEKSIQDQKIVLMKR